MPCRPDSARGFCRARADQSPYGGRPPRLPASLGWGHCPTAVARGAAGHAFATGPPRAGAARRPPRAPPRPSHRLSQPLRVDAAHRPPARRAADACRRLLLCAALLAFCGYPLPASGHGRMSPSSSNQEMGSEGRGREKEKAAEPGRTKSIWYLDPSVLDLGASGLLGGKSRYRGGLRSWAEVD